MKSFLNRILRPFGYLVIKAMAAVSDGWSNLLTGAFGNASKEKVNNSTALTVSSLFACIRNVSEDIGKMPLKVYRKDDEYRYEESRHPLTRLLQYQPNPEMTAISFRETLNAQAMGWGNAYAEIQRDISGRPRALWPLRPDRVTMYRETATDRPFYRVTNGKGGQSDIWAEDILHIHGLGFDGVSGYNIVQCAAQAVGAAIGMDKFAGAYFANGMHQSGILKHPGTLSAPAQKRLKKQLVDEYGGAEQAHQTLIIEEGMDFVANIIDPKASQMIETRQFSVTEFCRWLRVPPHKVADLTKATFSNIEEQNIDYVQDGLLGWCERWEQALWWKLLSEKEKQAGLYFEHVVEGLLRGNVLARYEAYSRMWDRGVLSINEIRSKENLNPIDGGNRHFVPMNFVPLEDAGQAGPVRAMVDDIAQRLAAREIKELERHAKHAEKDLPRFRQWLQGFYIKHDRYISEAIQPMCLSLKKSVCIDLLSLKLFMQAANAPMMMLEDRRDLHAKYIANNLRGYYETRCDKIRKQRTGDNAGEVERYNSRPPGGGNR